MKSKNLAVDQARFVFHQGSENGESARKTCPTPLSGGGFGWGHPRVIEAVKQQAATLPLSSRVFFSRPLAVFVKKLASVMPPGLEVCYPCNSAAEAVEGAVKLAKGFHKNRTAIVAFHHAYHGNTWGAMSLCGQPQLRDTLRQFPVKVQFLSFGQEAQLKNGITSNTACVVLEPFSALLNCEEALAKPFLKALAKRCTETGTILIVDETQTGLGVCGHWTWCQANGVQPDVIVLGNMLGGGILPAGAYVTKRKLNDKVYGRSHPALHGGTTAGNPLNCAAGTAVLYCIEQENLLQKAAGHATLIARFLESWRRVGQIRAMQVGMMAGIQFSNLEQWRQVMQQCGASGLSARSANAQPGSLLLNLPLAISSEDLRNILDKFDGIMLQVLSEAQEKIACAER